jgi:hypothetical protein
MEGVRAVGAQIFGTRRRVSLQLSKSLGVRAARVVAPELNSLS